MSTKVFFTYFSSYQEASVRNPKNRRNSDETSTSPRRHSFLKTISFGKDKYCFIAVDGSLEAILVDKDGYAAFKSFLQSEFSDENLELWKELQQFYDLPREKRKAFLFDIYEKYLRPNAPAEINMPSKLIQEVKNVIKSLEDGEPIEISYNLIAHVEKHILQTMRSDAYMRFKRSPLFSSLNFNNELS